MPSSNGVSAGRVSGMRHKGHNVPGPKITAFHTSRLSAQGAPEIPPGGSEDRRLKSRIRRRLDGVDWRRVSYRRSRICTRVPSRMLLSVHSRIHQLLCWITPACIDAKVSSFAPGTASGGTKSWSRW